MASFDLSIVLLILSAAFFVVSLRARRTANKRAIIHIVRIGLAIIIIVLAAFYFYRRFTGS